MRIAFAHISTEDDTGGVTTWLIQLAASLREMGWCVAVHLYHIGRDPENSNLAEILRSHNVEVFVQPQQSSAQAEVRQTLDFLNRWQPSVFLPQCQRAHFIAAAIAGRHGLPWVLTVHSDDPQYWSALRVLLPQATGERTVCVSRYLAAEVKRRGLDHRPFVIPYGVTLPSLQAGYKKQNFHVVYSGRVIKMQKRIDLVLAALIQACKASPQVRATIIGDGTELEECKRQVASCGLKDVIQFTGRVSPSKVQELLNDAHAMLLMSDYEGLPVALMESMAWGIVPVARSIPRGISELVHHEETGLLVSAEPEEASRAILQLAQDPALWRRLSTASRELISHDYGITMAHSQWATLLKNLHQESRPQYPIRDPLLHVTSTLQTKAIDFLWRLPQQINMLSQMHATAMARLKYQIKKYTLLDRS